MTIPIWAAVAAVMAILIMAQALWVDLKKLYSANRSLDSARELISVQDRLINALQKKCDLLENSEISEMPGWTGKERRTADAHVGYECATPDPQSGEWG